MRIIWFTNIPSPYRVDFFNELGKKCELTVVFETKFSSLRDDSWKNYSFDSFTGLFLKGKTINGESILPKNPKKQFDSYELNKYDIVIITNYSNITGILLVKYLKKRKINYLIEGDGAFPRKDKNIIKFLIKNKIISNSSLCFSTSKFHDEYYLKYGALKEDIVRYPFSSINNLCFPKRELSTNEKNCIKNRYNIDNDKKIVLNVGQFIYRKNNYLFFDVAKMNPDALFVLVGDGIEKNDYFLYLKNNDIKNVQIIPFLKKPEIYDLFMVSDLFLFTTFEDIWGLVINEATYFGLPVISSNMCQAATELVQDGLNGYVISSFDAKEYSDKLRKILFDEAALKSAKEHSFNISNNYTIEKMAQSHIDSLTSYLNKKTIYYLGYYLPNGKVTSGCSVAGNVMQRNILNSFPNTKYKVYCFTINPLSPFPKDKLYSRKFKIFDNNTNKTIIFNNFLNINYFKQFSQIRNMKKEIRKMLYKHNPNLFFGFNAFPVIGSCVEFGKRKAKCESLYFVADCPIPSMKYKFPSSIFRKIMDKRTIKYIKSSKYNIFINKNITDYYSLDCKSIVVNGFYSVDKKLNSNSSSESTFLNNSFLFAGSFSKYNCIDVMLESFSKIPELNLYIYGRGELQSLVENYSNNFDNIHFMGYAENDIIVKNEKCVDYLIMLRDNANVITKLTTPSKLFEYLNSGTPIVANNLELLPDELSPYLNEVDISSVESMIRGLNQIMLYKYNDLRNKAELAKNILSNEFSLTKNGEKISKFIEEIIYEKK